MESQVCCFRLEAYRVLIFTHILLAEGTGIDIVMSAKTALKLPVGASAPIRAARGTLVFTSTSMCVLKVYLLVRLT
jgi:hypothetical protein